MTRNFSVIAVYVVHYGMDYLEYSIKSIYDKVDKILLSVGLKSWTYKTTHDIDQRFLAHIYDLAKKYSKIEIVTVDSAKLDEEQRNLTIPHAAGYDYYFLVDFDEIYDGDSIDRLYNFVSANPGHSVYRIPFFHFWRGFGYRLEETIFKPVERLFRISRRFRFKWSSKSGFKEKAKINVPIDICSCFHFSYARMPDEIKMKTETWAHATDVRPNWFEDIFLKWPGNKEMIDIHPYKDQEELWKRAVFFDKTRLPDFMKDHPYYNMEIIE